MLLFWNRDRESTSYPNDPSQLQLLVTNMSHEQRISGDTDQGLHGDGKDGGKNSPNCSAYMSIIENHSHYYELF